MNRDYSAHKQQSAWLISGVRSKKNSLFPYRSINDFRVCRSDRLGYNPTGRQVLAHFHLCNAARSIEWERKKEESTCDQRRHYRLITIVFIRSRGRNLFLKLPGLIVLDDGWEWRRKLRSVIVIIDDAEECGTVIYSAWLLSLLKISTPRIKTLFEVILSKVPNFYGF